MPSASRRGFLGAVLGGAAAPLLARADPGSAPADEAAGSGPRSIRTTVNGASHACTVGEDETALSFVRDRCGLTGAKLGCGHGACGACAVAVAVDGVPVATCLLPAAHLDGRSVLTVEGLGAARLHPVQRAFLAEDALQCGYCTPGFVIEAAAFVDRWRAANGDSKPPLADVQAALAGHLCRCGAYAAIGRAVSGACAGRFDTDLATWPRSDGLEKVTGAAKYTVDVAPEGVRGGRHPRRRRAQRRGRRERGRGGPPTRTHHRPPGVGRGGLRRPDDRPAVPEGFTSERSCYRPPRSGARTS